MIQFKLKSPFVLTVLLACIGVGAMALAFWSLDHPLALPGSGLIAAVAVGTSFIACTGAFLSYLRWRDSRWLPVGGNARPMANFPQNPDGTIYALMPGERYRVVQPFTDYYGNPFAQDEALHFKELHFLPYHGGHTLVFEERSLYLQEEENQEILEHFSEYITLFMP